MLGAAAAGSFLPDWNVSGGSNQAPPSDQDAMRARGRAAAEPAYLRALSLAPG